MTVAPPLLVKEFLFKVCTHGGLLLIVKLQKSCGHQNRFWRGKSFEKPRLVAAPVDEKGFSAAASRYIILLKEFRRQAKMVVCAMIFIGAFAAFAVLEVYLFNRFCSGYVIKPHPGEDGLYAWEKRSDSFWTWTVTNLELVIAWVCMDNLHYLKEIDNRGR